MRILVVEDETKVARALREGLERERYEVVIASTGEEGFFLVNAQEFDLVILDLMLPGRDGLEVLSTLRKRGLDTPVLILTARDAIDDRVQGLDSGADDYLVKPFAFPELLARVRARLRRVRGDQSIRLKLADLELDLAVDSGDSSVRHCAGSGDKGPSFGRMKQGRLNERETKTHKIHRRDTSACDTACFDHPCYWAGAGGVVVAFPDSSDKRQRTHRSL